MKYFKVLKSLEKAQGLLSVSEIALFTLETLAIAGAVKTLMDTLYK